MTTRFMSLMVASVLVASACSADTLTTEVVPTTVAPTNTVAAAASVFCEVFAGIQTSTAESGGELSSAADWETRIGWTAQLVAAAPEELEDEAVIYLQLVKDRADLVAPYDYVSVQELPQEVKSSFIAENFENQQASNKLINYAHSSCTLDEDDGTSEASVPAGDEETDSQAPNGLTIEAAIFSKADHDGNARVSVEEMIQHMEEKRAADGEAPMSDQVVQQLSNKFLAHDEDDNGSLHFEEFEEFAASFG
ncbi:MAG: EF-hand domain-containing protein [Actinobacteria bacterium]|jgi:hypothetical protein|nr:EF-hand domain-containing protein [Actinomycetota bacterium]MBT3746678.1 EF-hand domain-containing protein [Actinomycetota bacterium]MBT3968904.1 EF-hand domain-containing protein [Actinomycetota bacterium]MBT4009545.1 EF-hand domain-containing protein [Actinomycetota bacterium]MBT4302526.1 EF-hand domain-containing protein [Actinomycetota bacterium]